MCSPELVCAAYKLCPDDLVYPSCVGVLSAIAYFSIVYCFTCMKTHIASENESGEVVYKEKYRHLMIIRGPRYVH